MKENPSAAKVLPRLQALFNAISEEALANPRFAAKIEASFADVFGKSTSGKPVPKPLRKPTQKVAEPVTFDPLECHIEAAILHGREQEARAFLGKLDRAQLEEVVRAQRLPGAKGLHKTIHESDPAAAVDAIVGSAAERVRSRYSAAS
jgi:hypothetical protein